MFQALLKTIRSFTADRGIMSVEFAVVGVPLIGMLLAVIETQLERLYLVHLDRAVQRFANDIRSGNILLANNNSKTLLESTLSANLCPSIKIIPGFNCANLQAQLFRNTACKSAGATSCWNSQYANFQRAVRNAPVFSSTPTFTIGAGGDSQYLTVYYPFPRINRLWNTTPTATVNGVEVYGLLSTAMWINDPSVGVYN